jgi:hypothetical protein
MAASVSPPPRLTCQCVDDARVLIKSDPQTDRGRPSRREPQARPSCGPRPATAARTRLATRPACDWPCELRACIARSRSRRSCSSAIASAFAGACVPAITHARTRARPNARTHARARTHTHLVIIAVRHADFLSQPRRRRAECESIDCKQYKHYQSAGPTQRHCEPGFFGLRECAVQVLTEYTLCQTLRHP